MAQTFSIGRFFDIRVGVHASWLLVFAFMTMTIAGAPPLREIARGEALSVAVIAALALFASVVIHEFAHALTARRFGVQTRGITLFLFGGVALLENEPPSPRADALIAIAGPIASAVLAVLAFGAALLVDRTAPGHVAEIIGNMLVYLSVANGALAIFNCIPAYPMDGGRVLRALLWHVRRSRGAATAAACLVGIAFAIVFGLAGLVAAISMHVWQYGWYVILAAFLLRQGYVQYREALRLARLETLAIAPPVAA